MVSRRKQVKPRRITTSAAATIQNDAMCKASNISAISELSMLVEKVGSDRDSKEGTVKSRNSNKSNVLACLQCAEQFNSLDELVEHISSTNHFSAMSFSKRIIAPWEMFKGISRRMPVECTSNYNKTHYIHDNNDTESSNVMRTYHSNAGATTLLTGQRKEADSDPLPLHKLENLIENVVPNSFI